MVKTHFKYLPSDIMYKLFKTYCMPLYGCPLWDFSNRIICKFYVSWRKAVRYILGLPRTTHCALLNEICSDIPVHEQLYSRFIKFIKGVTQCNNIVTKMAAKISMHGSNSIVSNNITIVSSHMSVSRYEVPFIHINRNICISDNASVIQDLLHMKYNNMFLPAFLSENDIKFMIEYLCTS